MQERPTLNRQLDSTTFRDFYWLKEELVDFCRNNGLSTAGGKLEITERIAHFLDTGEIVLFCANKKKSAFQVLKKLFILNNLPVLGTERIFNNPPVLRTEPKINAFQISEDI